MSYIAIIYRPENERRNSGMPFGMRGDRLFWYKIDHGEATATTLKKGAATVLEKIEQDAVALKKGVNFVQAAAWEAATKFSVNEAEIKRLEKSPQAIIVYAPDDPENCAQDTTDFADEMTVQELVEASYDVDWLNLSLNSDRRIPVRKAIDARLRELQEEASIRKQRMAGLTNTIS